LNGRPSGSREAPASQMGYHFKVHDGNGFSITSEIAASDLCGSLQDTGVRAAPPSQPAFRELAQLFRSQRDYALDMICQQAELGFAFQQDQAAPGRLR